MRCGLNSNGLGWGQMVDFCVHSNGHSIFIKGGGCLKSYAAVIFSLKFLHHVSLIVVKNQGRRQLT